ncbi:hypothetical protein ALI144C_15045 [Actinosynnema sp. ALI-1.44]|nr:hypothetical protein ALI144C_15045 [Actinosynnema sp. ALI-1.44]
MVARIELLAARFVARTPVDELADGGGTDMRVGINAALSTPGRPQLVIVLTDGHTPWPDENPACRMIAGLVGDRPPQPPAWVEAVRIR